MNGLACSHTALVAKPVTRQSRLLCEDRKPLLELDRKVHVGCFLSSHYTEPRAALEHHGDRCCSLPGTGPTAVAMAEEKHQSLWLKRTLL